MNKKIVNRILVCLLIVIGVGVALFFGARILVSKSIASQQKEQGFVREMAFWVSEFAKEKNKFPDTLNEVFVGVALSDERKKMLDTATLTQEDGSMVLTIEGKFYKYRRFADEGSFDFRRGENISKMYEQRVREIKRTRMSVYSPLPTTVTEGNARSQNPEKKSIETTP